MGQVVLRAARRRVHVLPPVVPAFIGGDVLERLLELERAHMTVGDGRGLRDVPVELCGDEVRAWVETEGREPCGCYLARYPVGAYVAGHVDASPYHARPVHERLVVLVRRAVRGGQLFQYLGPGDSGLLVDLDRPGDAACIRADWPHEVLPVREGCRLVLTVGALARE